jgi:hypothetical protein
MARLDFSCFPEIILTYFALYSILAVEDHVVHVMHIAKFARQVCCNWSMVCQNWFIFKAVDIFV